MESVPSWLGRSLSEGGSPNNSPSNSHTQIPRPDLPAGSEQAAIILFLAICFLIGILTQVTLKRLPIPYTALILIWGLFIGLMEARHVGWTYYSYGITFMRNLSPTMLLQIFLPIIGFSSGFGFDPHLIRKNLAQVFLLAWPGVLVITLEIGAFAYATFGYGWGWKESFLFGSMLSATDPVAVVALLKEVGASAKLGIVIEGESLFNDGTGFVCYLVFDAMVKGGAATPLAIFKTFMQLAFGGLSIGFAYGAVASYLLGFIQDTVAEIMLTLMTSYLAFYTADHLCQTSGLLAVVFCGVTMSMLGGSRVSPSAKEPMKLFWELAEWIVNTILFVYVGVVVGIVILSRDTRLDVEGEALIVGRDWAITVWLFVVLQITRLVMVVLFWPAMQFTGYPLGWRDILVTAWAGLRGIVGLVIGLVIYSDAEIADLRFRHLCLFHMGIMAVATIVINGATTGPLLRLLGMARNSPAKLQVLNKVYEDTEKLGSQYVQGLKNDDPLGLPDLQAVMQETRLDATPVFKEAIKSATAEEVVVQKPMGGFARVHAFKVAAPAAAVLADTRTRFLQALKATYGEGFEKGYIDDHEILDLREAIDVSLDHPEQRLSSWTHVREHACRMPLLVRMLGQLRSIPFVGTLANRAVFTKRTSHATLAAAFIHAVREAQSMLQEYLDSNGEGSSKDSAPRRAAVRVVLEESSKELEEATEFLRNLSRAYPAVPRAVKTTQVCTTILRRKERYLDLLSSAGLLDPKEHTELASILAERVRGLDITRFSNTTSSAKDALPSHPLFAGLTLDEIAMHVWPHVNPEAVDVGDMLCKRGAPVNSVCVVLGGLVAYGSRANTPASSAIIRIASPARSISGSTTGPQPGDRTSQTVPVAEALEDVVEQQPAVSAVPEPASHVVEDEPVSSAPSRLPLPGDAVGLVELLTEQESYDATVVASSPVELVRIASSTFLSMMQQLPSVQRAAWVHVAARTFSVSGPAGLKGKSVEELEQLFGGCTLQVAKPMELVAIPDSGALYLVHGTVHVRREGKEAWESLSGPTLLPSDSSACTAQTACTVLNNRLATLPSQRPGSALDGRVVRKTSSFQVLPGQQMELVRPQFESHYDPRGKVYEGGWNHMSSGAPTSRTQAGSGLEKAVAPKASWEEDKTGMGKAV